MESEAGVDKDVSDLKVNRMLSTHAKNILSDLELDSEDESGKFSFHRVLLQVWKFSSQCSASSPSYMYNCVAEKTT